MPPTPEQLAREVAEPRSHSREDWFARRSATMASGRIDWSAVADFGQVSDMTIAVRLGISQASVWNERTRRGIPAFVQPSTVALTARPALGGQGARFNGAVVAMTPVAPLAELPSLTRETGVLAALADLEPDARTRVLAYAQSKWGTP